MNYILKNWQCILVDGQEEVSHLNFPDRVLVADVEVDRILKLSALILAKNGIVPQNLLFDGSNEPVR